MLAVDMLHGRVETWSSQLSVTSALNVDTKGSKGFSYEVLVIQLHSVLEDWSAVLLKNCVLTQIFKSVSEQGLSPFLRRDQV